MITGNSSDKIMLTALAQLAYALSLKLMMVRLAPDLQSAVSGDIAAMFVTSYDY